MTNILVKTIILLSFFMSSIEASDYFVDEKRGSLTPHQTMTDFRDEIEHLLQDNFTYDKKFKSHVRRVLKNEIDHPTDRLFLVSAVISYKEGLESFQNLSELFNLFVHHMHNNTFHDFIGKANTIRRLWELKGEEALESLIYLSRIHSQGLLESGSQLLIQLSRISNFQNYLAHTSWALLKYIIKPLSEKTYWNSDLTDSLIKTLNNHTEERRQEGTPIGILSIESLYVIAKDCIVDADKYP